MTGDDVRALLRGKLDDSAAHGAARFSDFDLNGATRPQRALSSAAVLAPLVEREGEVRVIFTRRADHLPKHPGQISFPGGRSEPGDASLADTALREAEEEIGLSRGHVDLLGAFDAYETVTGYCVRPFIGFVDPAFVPRPDPNEVADVFEAPFAFLMDAANHQRHWREWNGARRYFYAMPYQDRYIWGATAGMLKALHARLFAEESAG